MTTDKIRVQGYISKATNNKLKEFAQTHNLSTSSALEKILECTFEMTSESNDESNSELYDKAFNKAVELVESRNENRFFAIGSLLEELQARITDLDSQLKYLSTANSNSKLLNELSNSNSNNELNGEILDDNSPSKLPSKSPRKKRTTKAKDSNNIIEQNN